MTNDLAYLVAHDPPRYLDGPALSPHRFSMAAAQTPTESDRAALIRAIANGRDRAAFIALFEYYAPRIKAQAMRHGLNADAAEDVAQDALLAVWNRAGQFDSARGSASAWVFTIATNARIDRQRRDKHIAAAAPIDPDSPLLTSDPIEGGADAAKLDRLVRDLPEEQRRILHLSFFTDLAHGEIASQLGIPLGTVKSRIRLAIGKLRQALGDDA